MARQATEDGSRAILPFIRKADEIEKHDPLVAYYTRMYAVEVGVKRNANRGYLEKVSKQERGAPALKEYRKSQQ